MRENILATSKILSDVTPSLIICSYWVSQVSTVDMSSGLELVDTFPFFFFFSSSAVAPSFSHVNDDEFDHVETRSSSDGIRSPSRIHDPLQTGIRRMGNPSSRESSSKIHSGKFMVRFEISNLRNGIQRVRNFPLRKKKNS
mgnify:FL=1